MKRILFSILLGFSIIGLSVTAARAAPLVSSDPGCSTDFLILLWNQADAVRARNRAYEMEVISQNRSVLELTCFDQTMKLSTRLGYIFSDLIPPPPPIPVQNNAVFGSLLAYSGWGAQQLLAKSMNNVMNAPPPAPPYGMYDQWIDNFPPLAPRPLPPNALSLLMDPGGAIVTAIQAIITFQNSSVPSALDDNQRVSNVTILTEEVDKLIAGIPKIAASSLGAYMQVIQDKIDLRQTEIAQITALRNAAMPPLLDDIRNAVMGGGAIICNNISTGDPQYLPGDLWTNGNPVSNFAPASAPCPARPCMSVCAYDTRVCCIWGTKPACPPPDPEYLTGSPYYTLEDLFYRTYLTTPPSAGRVFVSQTTLPNMNSLILDMAQADLLLLSKPGVLIDTPTQLPIWPEIPLTSSVFVEKPTVLQLIKDM
jgi:hypothetical protein